MILQGKCLLYYKENDCKPAPSLKKELNTVIDYTPKITACQNELEMLRSSIKDSFINK